MLDGCAKLVAPLMDFALLHCRTPCFASLLCLQSLVKSFEVTDLPGGCSISRRSHGSMPAPAGSGCRRSRQLPGRPAPRQLLVAGCTCPALSRSTACLVSHYLPLQGHSHCCVQAAVWGQHGQPRAPHAPIPPSRPTSPSGAVRTAKFVPRKQWVVCGSDDMFVRVYNYNTMDKVKQFEAHTDYIRWVLPPPQQPQPQPQLLQCQCAVGNDLSAAVACSRLPPRL